MGDKVVGAVNGADNTPGPSRGGCAGRRVLDRESREGRVAWGIVDGFEAEGRDDACGTPILDPPSEGSDLLADHLQRAAYLYRWRLRKLHTQEGQVTALPLRQG